jgi:hypothetical protein
MIKKVDVPFINENLSVKNAVIQITKKAYGCVLVVNKWKKVTGILNYLDYSFRVLRPEKKTYNEAIQLNESCPICQHKKCFTIYENDSEDRVKNIAKFSYSCHTSGKDHDYKLYPNNLDGIFMLLLEKPQKNVRKAVSRIIQELS